MQADRKLNLQKLDTNLRFGLSIDGNVMLAANCKLLLFIIYRSLLELF